jgi:hypothetical protein
VTTGRSERWRVATQDNDYDTMPDLTVIKI